MSLEPSFPFEFFVEGVPVSLQNKGRRSLREWKGLVRQRYEMHLLPGHWATESGVFVTIFYFPDARMEGDIDNIVKPILDAMNGTLYMDDRQVERVVVQKFEPGRMQTFINPTEVLASTLERERPIVYIRVDTEESLTAEAGR